MESGRTASKVSLCLNALDASETTEPSRRSGTMRLLLFLCAVTLSVGCSDSQPVPAPPVVETPVMNRVSRAELEEMFANIPKEPSWNMDGDMVWGYFFTDTDRPKLEQAAKKLVAQGYRYVEVFEAENEDASVPYFFLHVEKVEIHNVDSLYRRNTELEAFAKQNGLDTYDGMDVGPVKPEPKRN